MILANIELAERSVSSLQRHWKETGEKTINQDESPSINKNRVWRGKFNIKQVLTCSEEKFNRLLSSKEFVKKYRKEYMNHSANSR